MPSASPPRRRTNGRTGAPAPAPPPGRRRDARPRRQSDRATGRPALARRLAEPVGREEAAGRAAARRGHSTVSGDGAAVDEEQRAGRGRPAEGADGRMAGPCIDSRRVAASCKDRHPALHRRSTAGRPRFTRVSPAARGRRGPPDAPPQGAARPNSVGAVVPRYAPGHRRRQVAEPPPRLLHQRLVVVPAGIDPGVGADHEALRHLGISVRHGGLRALALGHPGRYDSSPSRVGYAAAARARADGAPPMPVWAQISEPRRVREQLIDRRVVDVGEDRKPALFGELHQLARNRAVGIGTFVEMELADAAIGPGFGSCLKLAQHHLDARHGSSRCNRPGCDTAARTARP